MKDGKIVLEMDRLTIIEMKRFQFLKLESPVNFTIHACGDQHLLFKGGGKRLNSCGACEKVCVGLEIYY